MSKLAKSEKWRLVRGTDLKTQDRYCLLTLFLFQGDNKHAFCKQETMAAEMGVTTRHIRRSLKRLAEAGAVFREWKNINRIPMRCYAIDFDVLATIQRNDGRTPASYPDDGRTPASATVGHPRPKGADTRVLQEHPVTSKEQISLFSTSLDDLFEQFWKAYGKDAGKKKAKPAFAKVVKNGTAPEVLLRQAEKYAATFNGSNKYQKHATTWLNGENWNDELACDATADFEAVREIIYATYSPDLKNTADVEAKLTAEQFAAADRVGIPRIANSHPPYNGIATEFTAARKATA